MHVSLTHDMKKYISLEETPVVRKLIADMKEEEDTAEDALKMAVNVIGTEVGYGINCCDSVLYATAEIAKNCRVNNYYNDDSKDFDIWINGVARTLNGFVEVGAYLSDIWQIGGVDNVELVRHMYVRRFEEVV